MMKEGKMILIFLISILLLSLFSAVVLAFDTKETQPPASGAYKPFFLGTKMDSYTHAEEIEALQKLQNTDDFKNADPSVKEDMVITEMIMLKKRVGAHTSPTSSLRSSHRAWGSRR